MNKKVFGFFILTIGVLSLIQNFSGTQPIYSLITFGLKLLWPLFFIFFAMQKLKESNGKSLLPYLLFMFSFFLIRDDLTSTFPIFAKIDNFFWPIVFIVIGLAILNKPINLLNIFNKYSSGNYRFYTNDNSAYKNFDDDIRIVDDDKKSDTVYTFNKGHIPSSKTSQAKEQTTSHKSSTEAGYKMYKNSFASRRIEIKESELKEGTTIVELHSSFGEVKLLVPRTVNLKLDGQISFGEIKFLSKKYQGNSIAKAKYSAEGSKKTIHIKAKLSLGEIIIAFAD